MLFGMPHPPRPVTKGTHRFRVVPLSALPWPHSQRCALGKIAEREPRAAPDSQAAHAAAFLSTEGRRAMASCKYHKPDWVRLVRILREAHDQGDGNDVDLKAHPEYGQLSGNEQEWLYYLVVDPIGWSDDSTMLGGGQNRLCALRAAGIEACPVWGRALAETDYGIPVDASDHARNAITASWKSYASKHGWPAWAGMLASRLPRFIRTRLIINEDT